VPPPRYPAAMLIDDQHAPLSIINHSRAHQGHSGKELGGVLHTRTRI
jgi:hypothetical protein